MTGPRSSTALAALRSAAAALQLPDPAPVAEQLERLDGDGLYAWFETASDARQALLDASDTAAEAIPMLQAGWSNAAAPARLGRLCDAAEQSATVIAQHVHTADDLRSALLSVRVGTADALATAESAVSALGVPVPGDPAALAVQQGRDVALERILLDLLARLDSLRTQASAALEVAADALRSDPRDALQSEPIASADVVPTSPGLAPTLATSPEVRPDTAVDATNRHRLQQDLQSADDPVRLMAEGVSAALARAGAAAGAARLLVYEPPGTTAQGRAAVALGDVGAADNVAVLVPGVGSSPRAMADLVPAAARLRASTIEQAPGDTAAAVVWTGYDAPVSWSAGVPVAPGPWWANTTAIVGDENARDGGALLSADVATMRGLLAPSARMTGYGFSMGATTVSAAAQRGAELDGLLFMASPGASEDVEHVGDLRGVPAEHTYAVAFAEDPVPSQMIDAAAMLGEALISVSPLPFGGLVVGSGPFGPDPTSAEFGAQVVDAETNLPRVTLENLGKPDLLGPGDIWQVADGLRHHSLENYLSGEAGEAAAALNAGRYSEIEVRPGN